MNYQNIKVVCDKELNKVTGGLRSTGIKPSVHICPVCGKQFYMINASSYGPVVCNDCKKAASTSPTITVYADGVGGSW